MQLWDNFVLPGKILVSLQFFSPQRRREQSPGKSLRISASSLGVSAVKFPD